jgi:hypothetical protein
MNELEISAISISSASLVYTRMLLTKDSFAFFMQVQVLFISISRCEFIIVSYSYASRKERWGGKTLQNFRDNKDNRVQERRCEKQSSRTQKWRKEMRNNKECEQEQQWEDVNRVRTEKKKTEIEKLPNVCFTPKIMEKSGLSQSCPKVWDSSQRHWQKGVQISGHEDMRQGQLIHFCCVMCTL